MTEQSDSWVQRIRDAVAGFSFLFGTERERSRSGDQPAQPAPPSDVEFYDRQLRRGLDQIRQQPLSIEAWIQILMIAQSGSGNDGLSLDEIGSIFSELRQIPNVNPDLHIEAGYFSYYVMSDLDQAGRCFAAAARTALRQTGEACAGLAELNEDTSNAAAWESVLRDLSELKSRVGVLLGGSNHEG